MEKPPKDSYSTTAGVKNPWLDRGEYVKKRTEDEAIRNKQSQEPVLLDRKQIREFNKKEIITSVISGPDTRPHKLEVEYKIQVFEEKYRNTPDGSITTRLAEKNTLISQKDLGAVEDTKINPLKSERKPQKQTPKAA